MQPSRYCMEHGPLAQQKYEKERGTSSERGYGTDWKPKRKRILERDPVCKECNAKPSKHADHIVARRKGGSDDDDNLQGLCHGCHSRKTATEDGRWG